MRRAIAIPPISMDTASFAIVGKVVVMDEKYGMGKCRESRALRRTRCEKLPGERRACLQARRMNAQREIAESVPAAQHPRQRGMERRDSPARNETAIATANAGHSAQQLGCGCGRIVVGHCVTPRDPRKAILISSPFDQSMNKETVVAQNQHDVSGNDLVVRCALNREQIARPHRGKHARSPCLQLNGAAAAKHLGRKTKLGILASFQRGWHRWQQTTRYAG